ncbi:hypothetical protein [Glaciihabitans sp. GrIS 2.15]|uniref:hypothetical protein n=1 Tax=Glaciihabitans sp. GrIS 2.15 TaxID=3071710 RepID=UPI002E045E94|nr:hypothetical protein [Glaciihabitans sp. GrIS 2.15]
MTNATEVEIVSDRAHREVDLKFSPQSSDSEDIDELQDVVLPSIDGASMKSNIRDSLVTVRARDFDEVVERIAAAYRARGLNVSRKTVTPRD